MIPCKLFFAIVFGFIAAVRSDEINETEVACKNTGYTWKSEFGCYKVYTYVKNTIKENKNWAEARDVCTKDGADLITIDTSDDARKLYVLMWKESIWQTWVNGRKNEFGSWESIDGAHYEPSACQDDSVIKCNFKNETNAENNCLLFYSLQRLTSLNSLSCSEMIDTIVCKKANF